MTFEPKVAAIEIEKDTPSFSPRLAFSLVLKIKTPPIFPSACLPACSLYKSLLSGLRQRMIYIVLGCLTFMPRECPWLGLCRDWSVWTVESFRGGGSKVPLRSYHEAVVQVDGFIDLQERCWRFPRSHRWLTALCRAGCERIAVFAFPE